MIAIQLSVQQLIEALHGLNDEEKVQVREALNQDIELSTAEIEELKNRKRDYLEGRSTSKPWAAIKSKYENI